jgi:hypothetical protein
MGFAQDSRTGESIAIGCLVIRDANTRLDTFGLTRGLIRHYFSRPQMVASNTLKTASQAAGARTLGN